MKLKRLSPNLMSDNLSETVKFYTELLGFTVTMHVPEEPPYAWMAVEKDGCEMMFQSRESMAEARADFARESIGEGMGFFMEVEGLDALYEKLKAAGVIIMAEPHVTFYGMKEFEVKDNNGYLLVFAESVSAS